MEVELNRLHKLLEGASRTFALTIPMLPSPPLDEAVTLSYLLFRIADTIEDAYLLSKEVRIRELKNFIEVLKWPHNYELAQEFVKYFREKDHKIQDPGHLKVLYQTPFIIKQLMELPANYVEVIIKHIIRTAKEMQHWIELHDKDNHLSLQSLEQLQDYCYTAAGIVGKMLTRLFALYSPEIKEKLPYLQTYEVGLATGLQLTNIIKDFFQDHQEGRHYIPEQYLPLGPTDNSDKIIPIFGLAYKHLTQGIEFVLALPAKEVGVRKFCLIPIILAAATLVHLFNHRKELYLDNDVKISKSLLLYQVNRIVANNQRIQQFWEKQTDSLKEVSQ